MINYLNTLNWEKIVRTTLHALLIGGTYYLSTHPELAGYSLVLTYIASQIDGAK